MTPRAMTLVVDASLLLAFTTSLVVLLLVVVLP
jgi:hypothetical protein